MGNAHPYKVCPRPMRRCRDDQWSSADEHCHPYGFMLTLGGGGGTGTHRTTPHKNQKGVSDTDTPFFVMMIRR